MKPHRRIKAHAPLLALIGTALLWAATAAILVAAMTAMAGCQPTVRIEPAKSQAEAVREETKPKTTTTTTTVITISPKGAPSP